MKITILTQFPDMFTNVLKESILGRASDKGLVSFNVVNIRDYTKDKHNRTDDTPFGGGNGMIMSPQPAFDALYACNAKEKKVLYMSPRGRMLDKNMALDLSKEDELVILCGHYEGIDQRIIDNFNMQEVSIGDYILTGGELAAMVLTDTVVRLIPGCLASTDASIEESVYSGLLEYDQYTKPRVYEGCEVPEVLFSGDHEKIHLWQYENQLRLTKEKRPDLFEAYINAEHNLTKKEKQILLSVSSESK